LAACCAVQGIVRLAKAASESAVTASTRRIVASLFSAAGSPRLSPS
jgi:hypothetical protein